MVLLREIEISEEELMNFAKAQLTIDADTFDNRDRFFDCLLDYGCKFSDKNTFKENLVDAIANSIGAEEFIKLLIAHKEEVEL